jgi:hypothetical protein
MARLVPDALKGFNLSDAQISGIIPINTLGHNITIGITGLQDLTTFGEDFITQPTSITSFEVRSTSIQDDNSGGTGAKKVEIIYLDINWSEQSYIVVLNGTTPVTQDESANTLQAIKFISITVIDPVPTNAQHTAVGDITAKAIGDGITYAKIDAGGNQELACRRTIPDGFTFYMDQWKPSIGKLANNGDEVAFYLRGTCTKKDRTLTNNVFIFQDIAHLLSNGEPIPIRPVLTFPSRCEIKVSAQLNGGGTAVGSASFEGWLVPNA